MADAIATNKKAYHNYFLTDKWECGIELKGGEVKSLRAGEATFSDSYVSVEKNELWLNNFHIAPYAQASYLNTDPDRPRKILMHAKEIKRISDMLFQRSATIVPTKIYFNKRGLAKVEIALGQGKKLYDKRADIKERDIKREMARATRRSW